MEMHFHNNKHMIQNSRFGCYYWEINQNNASNNILNYLLHPFPIAGVANNDDCTSTKGLVGLHNLGNTCYMNSALQALSNLPPLTRFFLTSDDLIDHVRTQRLSKRSVCLAHCYQELIQEMWSADQHCIIDPRSILYCLRSTHVMFRGYHQHDSQEFLRCFIDQLHEELKEQVNTSNSHINSEKKVKATHSCETDDESEEELKSFPNTASEADSEYESCASNLSGCSTPNHREQSPFKTLPNTTKLKQTPKESEEYKHRSIISDAFDGKVLSSVQCLTCDRLSTREETFQDLSLPIPNDDFINSYTKSDDQSNEGWLFWFLSFLRYYFYGPVVTLHNCMASFFSADELKGDNMYSCEQCKKLRTGIKFSQVMELPELLCIHLKRFRHDLCNSSKISTHVQFPLEGFDMSPYVHRDCKSRTTVYQLASVICHHGSVTGGHYTCYSRNNLNGCWYEFNDANVTEVTPETVQGSQAYVLFYQKHNPQMDGVREDVLELNNTHPVNAQSIRFYIARSWLLRLGTFAEPGPIDNYDILCAHGGISHSKLDRIHQLAVPVSQSVWHFLYKKFGGGPTVSILFECDICKRNADAIAARQKYELSFLMRYGVGNIDMESCAIYAISMTWFRAWQEFAKGNVQQPPGSIYNENIAARVAAGSTASVRAGSYYTHICAPLWYFLYQTYGGGPEILVRNALYELDPEEEQNNEECSEEVVSNSFVTEDDVHVEHSEESLSENFSTCGNLTTTTTLVSENSLETADMTESSHESKEDVVKIAISNDSLNPNDCQLLSFGEDTLLSIRLNNRNARRTRSTGARVRSSKQRRKVRRELKRSGLFGPTGSYRVGIYTNGNFKETENPVQSAPMNGKHAAFTTNGIEQMESNNALLCNGSNNYHKTERATLTLQKYNHLSESSSTTAATTTTTTETDV